MSSGVLDKGIGMTFDQRFFKRMQGLLRRLSVKPVGSLYDDDNDVRLAIVVQLIEAAIDRIDKLCGQMEVAETKLAVLMSRHKRSGSDVGRD